MRSTGQIFTDASLAAALETAGDEAANASNAAARANAAADNLESAELDYQALADNLSTEFTLGVADSVENAENLAQQETDNVVLADGTATNKPSAFRSAENAFDSKTEAALKATEAAASKAAASSSASSSATSKLSAAASALVAQGASESAGALASFDTKADATAALGGLDEHELVLVLQDESRSGVRARYRKQSGVLVHKIDEGFVAEMPNVLTRPQRTTMRREDALAIVRNGEVDHVELRDLFGRAYVRVTDFDSVDAAVAEAETLRQGGARPLLHFPVLQNDAYTYTGQLQIGYRIHVQMDAPITFTDNAGEIGLYIGTPGQRNRHSQLTLRARAGRALRLVEPAYRRRNHARQPGAFRRSTWRT